MKTFVIFVFEFLIIKSVCSTDQTLVEKAKGPGVVEAVCSKIETTCIFENDNLFLRRIAFVETGDGIDPKTYRTGYSGGIWQVDQAMFDNTKASSVITTHKQKIKSSFGIDWDQTKWSDLEKPFYSGLAARLFLQINGNKSPDSINGQAKLWASYFRVGGNEAEFVTKSKLLDTNCRRGAADVLFVVDESYSIGVDNFNRIKDFLKSVVTSLNVGPDPTKDTRLSIVKFATNVKVAFDFTTYSNLSEYLEAIGNMTYDRGLTYTYLALKHLREKAFESASGARLEGVPRIAIVLTDGRSANFAETVREANNIKTTTDITVISVGIGYSLNINELQAIASEPYCRHLYILDNFLAFDSFIDIIERKTCEAPLTVVNRTITTVPISGQRPCKISITSNGTTVEVITSQGTSIIYFSDSTIPSSSYYDLKLTAGSDFPSVLHLPCAPKSSGSTTYAYCLIEGDSKMDIDVTIGTCPGDCDPCKKKPCRAAETCRADVNFNHKCVQPKTPAYDCTDNNPCTSENAKKRLFYFPASNKNQYVQCSEWGQCYIMFCPFGLVWNERAYTCTF